MGEPEAIRYAVARERLESARFQLACARTELTDARAAKEAGARLDAAAVTVLIRQVGELADSLRRTLAEKDSSCPYPSQMGTPCGECRVCSGEHPVAPEG